MSERRWFTGRIDHKKMDDSLDPQAELVLFYGNIPKDNINDCIRVTKVPGPRSEGSFVHIPHTNVTYERPDLDCVRNSVLCLDCKDGHLLVDAFLFDPYGSNGLYILDPEVIEKTCKGLEVHDSFGETLIDCIKEHDINVTLYFNIFIDQEGLYHGYAGLIDKKRKRSHLTISEIKSICDRSLKESRMWPQLFGD
jgi:hypothetical protein